MFDCCLLLAAAKSAANDKRALSADAAAMTRLAAHSESESERASEHQLAHR